MLKLNKSVRPDDLSARMPLRLEKKGDVLTTKDGQEGWIEFWAEDATAIKARLKAIGARLYRINLRQQKRTAKELEAMSDQALQNELDEMKGLTVEALAIRTKAWFLIDSEGEAHPDHPVTMENARELFSDDDHELRALATEWLSENADAFLPTKKPG